MQTISRLVSSIESSQLLFLSEGDKGKPVFVQIIIYGIS